ncbi:8-amino-7-oxononanoate synthase [Bienertia sinuspersici]
MAYVNSRPYGGNYCEGEVVSPYGGSYSNEYRIDEYGNRVPHHHHHHTPVGGVIGGAIPDGYDHHHHYGRPTEIIERREERIVEAPCDPYQRVCLLLLT